MRKPHNRYVHHVGTTTRLALVCLIAVWPQIQDGQVSPTPISGGISGASVSLTSNQNNLNLTTLGPQGWRFMGSAANYSEYRAGHPIAISPVTTSAGGRAYLLNSKIVYPYWTNGAGSPPFYYAIQGSSLVDLRTNSGGLVSQSFTAIVSATPRVLSVLTVAANNATTHLTASFSGGTYASAESVAGSEVYNRYDITFSGPSTDRLSVTLLNSVGGSDAPGQPAIAIVAVWLRDATYTPSTIPQLLTGLDDPTSGLIRPTGTHVHSVSLSDDFQTLLNTALSGDEYDFPDGYIATGTFVLPHRTDVTDYVWFVHLPTRNALDYTMRVNPGDFASGVLHQPPKLQTANASPVLSNDFMNATDALRSTRGWIFDGFEITSTFASTYQLVLFAPADPNGGDYRSALGTVPTAIRPEI